MNWQAVFFDFDGVIVDSAPIKTAAFAAMLRPYGETVEKAVVTYHLGHQGISRFDKFRYFYEHILHAVIDENRMKALGDEFSTLVLEAVINAPYLPGVMDTLVELQSLQIPAYIISGTPDEEMKYIVQCKDLSSLFKGVYGTPRKKDEIVGHLLETGDYVPSKCLFIGDSLTDYEAAEKHELCFLGIVMDGSDSPFPAGTWTSPRVTTERS